jgi:hypothetical protein
MSVMVYGGSVLYLHIGFLHANNANRKTLEFSTGQKTDIAIKNVP